MRNTTLHPWHLMVAILAGIVNREQQRAIEYLRTENQILRENIRYETRLPNSWSTITASEITMDSATNC